MTKKIEIKYESVAGTQVEGGYFVPDIWVTVKRKGFVGWLFRLVGSKRGYQDVKMYEALLNDIEPSVRTFYVPRGAVIIETCNGETLEFDTDGLIDSFKYYPNIGSQND